MTDSKTGSVAVKNYTKAQEDAIKEASPMDWAGAKALGLIIGKSPQSVVAKVGNMGLEYIPKPAPRKKAVQATKVELCARIQKILDRDMTGLEKATRGVLLLIINGLEHAIPAKVEPELPEVGDSD